MGNSDHETHTNTHTNTHTHTHELLAAWDVFDFVVVLACRSLCVTRHSINSTEHLCRTTVDAVSCDTDAPSPAAWDVSTPAAAPIKP